MLVKITSLLATATMFAASPAMADEAVPAAGTNAVTV